MCFIDPEPPTSPPPSFFAIFQAAKIVICILLWLKIGRGGTLGKIDIVKYCRIKKIK